MSFAIQNKEGEHLGFLLIAGEGMNGDCIFRFLPSNPALFSSQDTALLRSYQEQGEFQWQRSSKGLMIKNANTGSEAILNDNKIEMNGQKFTVINMSTAQSYCVVKFELPYASIRKTY